MDYYALINPPRPPTLWICDEKGFPEGIISTAWENFSLWEGLCRIPKARLPEQLYPPDSSLKEMGNLGFCRMVGRNEEKLLGKKPPFVYWPPEELDYNTRVFQAAMNSKGLPRRHSSPVPEEERGAVRCLGRVITSERLSTSVHGLDRNGWRHHSY